MARITSIIPPCGYVVDGVDSILLLDWEDFRGFAFLNGDLYTSCMVTGIMRVSAFTQLASVNAKYSSTQSGNINTHTIETFVSILSADSISNLNLAKRRRYVPVFSLNNGKYYTYGYEAGAAVTYNNQTAEAIGSLITVTASSVYPLFEVDPAALTTYYGVEFMPDFINGVFCEIA